MPLSLNWDLDKIFSEGNSLKEVEHLLENIRVGLTQLEKNLVEKSHFPSILELFQTIALHLRQIESFVSCLIAQNDQDTHALCLQDRFSILTAQFQTLTTQLDHWLLEMDPSSFTSLSTRFPNLAFFLQEKREMARMKLDLPREELINELAIDGYQGWMHLWDALIRGLSFSHQNRSLSFNQVTSLLQSTDPSIRKEAFLSLHNSIKPFQNSFAQALNHLMGFRIKTYRKRGWETPLAYALKWNRLKEKTLEIMWEKVILSSSFFSKFLSKKAALLGKPRLSWYDLSVPSLPSKKEVSYREASVFLVKHFSAFSPKMASFTESAFQKQWIDAENRPGKGAGGFCTSFPLSQQSRIFLTYSNTLSSLFVLAHELGHAFHDSILFPLPYLSQICPMSLAETASTMAEQLVMQASIHAAQTPEETLSLLEMHLTNAASYLFDIRARFLFEEELCKKRAQGFVPAETLSELMEEAQKNSCPVALDTYHPLFWTTKPHFFLDHPPFYNFPYTVGYLLSLGIYSLSSSLSHFEKRYIDFLRETGQMDIETLMKKHFDIDLTKPDLWDLVFQKLEEDTNRFCALSETMLRKGTVTKESTST